MSRLRPHRSLASAIALAIIPVPLAGMSMPSDAPAPMVLAWASFLGPDGVITTATPWSSGELWQPVIGDWSQVGAAMVSTRGISDSRALATVAPAGSAGRVAAIVSSLDGLAVRDAGVVTAATASGTRHALIARIGTTGALEIVLNPGRPIVIGTSSVGAVSESVVEVTLQLQGTTAVATSRPLASREPTVVVSATLTPTQLDAVAGQNGYGVYADRTTGVAFTALRVEVPA